MTQDNNRVVGAPVRPFFFRASLMSMMPAAQLDAHEWPSCLRHCGCPMEYSLLFEFFAATRAGSPLTSVSLFRLERDTERE
jgi:hypothetical protein